MNARTFTITYKFRDIPTTEQSKWGVQDRSGTYAITYTDSVIASQALNLWTKKFLGHEYIQTSYDCYTPLTVTILQDDISINGQYFSTVYSIVYKKNGYVIDYMNRG